MSFPELMSPQLLEKLFKPLKNAIEQRSYNAREKVNLRFEKAGYSKFEQI